MCTLQGKKHIPQKWHFEYDFPFPQVGYVNSLEGILMILYRSGTPFFVAGIGAKDSTWNWNLPSYDQCANIHWARAESACRPVRQPGHSRIPSDTWGYYFCLIKIGIHIIPQILGLKTRCMGPKSSNEDLFTKKSKTQHSI